MHIVTIQHHGRKHNSIGAIAIWHKTQRNGAVKAGKGNNKTISSQIINSCHEINRKKKLCNSQQYCTSILETVSHHINTGYDELAAHRLLSIFKMAEVQVIWPDMNGAAAVSAKHVNLMLLTITLTLLRTVDALRSHRIAFTWRLIRPTTSAFSFSPFSWVFLGELFFLYWKKCIFKVLLSVMKWNIHEKACIHHTSTTSFAFRVENLINFLDYLIVFLEIAIKLNKLFVSIDFVI